MEDSGPQSQSTARTIVLEGIGGSPGLGIGRASVVDNRRGGVARRHVAKHAVHDELARFDRAVRAASRALLEIADRLRGGTARAESSILEAYIMMVEDESLRTEVERHIRIDYQCAEWALENAVRAMAEQLRLSGDSYLAERSHDFEFVGDRILAALTGHQRASMLLESDEPTIVVAHDLSPAETAAFTKDKVLGMVTEVGTRTSHTAILARALEIPAVVGVVGVLSRIGNGDFVVIDGQRGRVVISPTDEMINEVIARAERRKVAAAAMREERDRPAATRCGTTVDLCANIELPAETEMALAQGARGIGLYRTEFLYMDRFAPPSEDEQHEIYVRVLQAMAPRPVTLRTFDIGGDKFVSAFQVPPDMNPALGLRAVRLGLARPELFAAQLRAMVRASAEGALRIMIPMIASVSELRAVRELFAAAVAEIDARGLPRAKHIPLGIMVEVPSAAIMAAELARDAEFLSIGTNDLVQYALAVDRGSPGLAYLASPFDPAILKLIKNVVEAGGKYSREVSVCGTMASDPVAAVLLVGMGLRALSLEAASIPKVKVAIGRFSLAEAEQVAARALTLGTAKDVEALVEQTLAKRLVDLDGDD